MKLFALFAFVLLVCSFGCTRIAKTVNEPSFCEGNDNDTEKDNCFYVLAKQTNDSTACTEIVDVAIKANCTAEISG
jgi:hypothetical protein